MTTTAQTWFYSQPERNAYAIGERVRTNFWDERFSSLWLDCVRAEAPILMRGWWDNSTVELEWDPGRWLALRTAPAAPKLAEGVRRILGLKPAVRYEDADGRAVWEWHTDGGDKRWQAIQGIPAFRHPVRLNKE